MKRYAKYHLRWQVSALVMALPMMWLTEMYMNPVISLFIVQFFGAIIFYPVDKYIFKSNSSV